MSILYGLSGTTTLHAMASVFAGQEGDPLLVLAVILIVAGMGFKIAAVPVSMWGPHLDEGAATPVTPFLSVRSRTTPVSMLSPIPLRGRPVLTPTSGPRAAA